ncbi:hypothetical protein [Bacillus toyonensis]|uniref:hypothetical protein n=1 Tax=Bacillus toyonensis TaxID=155322 RepID=UPI00211D6C95|nr:hypothetical protein [Bacillus toyonensis]
MKNTDRRNRLDDRMFHYRITKNNIVLIEYYGKQIMILKGNDAEKFLNKINHANNDKEQQLIMAKITGNFKREMNVIENESHFFFLIIQHIQ